MTQLGTIAPRRRPRRVRMCYEQFLKWDGENQHVEWVDGEVVPMPPISNEHTDVGAYLIGLFQLFVFHFRVGAVKYEPFQMKTGPHLPGRAPDLFFVSKRKLRRLHKTYLEGPADLVVEIISPDSKTIDRVEKFREYEQGGVREYWLIDPEHRTAEFYRRVRDGRFRQMPVGGDGVFRSSVLKGLWIKMDWLWDRPSLVTVQKEWRLG